MPLFRYIALDAKGNEITDTIEALSQKEAINRIRNKGLFPTKVKLAPSGQSLTGDKPEPNKSVSADPKENFLFPNGSKCRCKHGIEIFSGRINIWGEDGKRFVVFKSNPNSLQQQQTISIDLDNIQNIEKKGFFRTSHIINTKNGDEYVFTGNIGQIGDVLRFELISRGLNS